MHTTQINSHFPNNEALNWSTQKKSMLKQFFDALWMADAHNFICYSHYCSTMNDHITRQTAHKCAKNTNFCFMSIDDECNNNNNQSLDRIDAACFIYILEYNETGLRHILLFHVVHPLFEWPSQSDLYTTRLLQFTPKRLRTHKRLSTNNTLIWSISIAQYKTYSII